MLENKTTGSCFKAVYSSQKQELKYPKEIQNYFAQYQQDAYKNTTDGWPSNWKRQLWRWGYSIGPRFYDFCRTSTCFTVLELQ